jgi:hypothetical protein
MITVPAAKKCSGLKKNVFNSPPRLFRLPGVDSFSFLSSRWHGHQMSKVDRSYQRETSIKLKLEIDSTMQRALSRDAVGIKKRDDAYQKGKVDLIENVDRLYQRGRSTVPKAALLHQICLPYRGGCLYKEDPSVVKAANLSYLGYNRQFNRMIEISKTRGY